tara:strand:- start:1383 stop:1601 length:219 start_codon:yes stop_codon:yes gene_type:complete
MPALIAFPSEASDDSLLGPRTRTTTPENPRINPNIEVSVILCDQNTKAIIAAKKGTVELRTDVTPAPMLIDA